jgi:predicted protein tyrosine phosphatase
MNMQRSPTAENIYKNDPRVQVRSAGLSESSRCRLTAKHIEWADLILVMENKHKHRMLEVFRGRVTFPRIECLQITDEHGYMTPELIEQIKAATEPYIEAKS